jgi:hypothetical protein
MFVGIPGGDEPVGAGGGFAAEKGPVGVREKGSFPEYALEAGHLDVIEKSPAHVHAGAEENATGVKEPFRLGLVCPRHIVVNYKMGPTSCKGKGPASVLTEKSLCGEYERRTWSTAINERTDLAGGG